MKYNILKPVALATIVSAAAVPNPAPQTGGDGPYTSYYFADATLTDHTIYQPKTVPTGLKLPVLLWGNGACADDGTGFQAFLGEVASYGFFVIADGPINGTESKSTTSAVIKASLEWVTTNGGKGAYAQVDTTKIAVSGQSCGGLEAYDLRADPRIFTIGIFNSGEFAATDSKTVAGSITKPIFYFLGGSSDIAYANGERDYSDLPATTPAWLGNYPAGHISTFINPNAGVVGTAGTRWLQWLLQGNTTAAEYFTGTGAKKDGWTAVSQNLASITPL
ncbi:hypothetical protein L207DRAFT_580802 [Hyaloscypha variabilis F]|uniref:Alpha/beta-hydrolase n=1 Tax=Hyaloscypha variabilis (strain UAMH 11265 / GT02V1 / F) TaxID=1149755 RepID=A0A2J6RUD4_HYAVF|nr:hypothetical protein L207DRAFT_580802 [Hyaloscypha variabilis F]